MAKEWLLNVMEATPLEQIERLPLARITSSSPLVAELARAAEGEPASASERAAWLDRLAALRGDEADAPLVRDVGVCTRPCWPRWSGRP